MCCASATVMSLQFSSLQFAQNALLKEILHYERGLDLLGALHGKQNALKQVSEGKEKEIQT